MKLILCSKKDPASMNIKNAILSIEDTDKKRIQDREFYFGNDFIITEIEERLIYADRIDEVLSKYIKFDEIIFASRHSSKDKRKIFTVHVSGNVGSADFGGKPYSLAKPSPITMKNYVLAIKNKLDRKPEFEFTLEVTHHGPSEISTPSAFYEIGSTESEWRDEEAGMIVAESILEAIRDGRRDWNVAVGVGGTHYAPRQTEIILTTNFTFGHNFAKYTFNDLNEDIIIKAIELSEAKFIVYDEKSVISKIKKMLQNIAERIGIDVLKTKEVKKNFTINIE